MKKLTVITALLATGLALQAQNEVDALRYSQTGFGGTARFSSMGGAFGALGADFSSLSFNPAGIALYRKGELTFTPTLYHATTNSTYYGNTLADDKYNFNFNNFGLVLAATDDGEKALWKGIAMGFGYNRLANYHNRVYFEGVNDQSSLLDVFAANAQNQTDIEALDPFGSQLAFYTGVIDTSSAGNYYTVIPNYGERQIMSLESRGSMGEILFTLGGNYMDKLYIGGTFFFPSVRFTQSSTYIESVENDSLYGFESYSYNSDLSTSGSGYGFKFGMIYRPVDWLRIGGAVHTPAILKMSDTYSNSMTSNFSSGTYSAASPTGAFDYTLTTPMRAMASMGFIINKFAAVNVDYEFVDYSESRLNSPTYKYVNENKAIRDKYTATSNVRAGAEFRLKPLSIRAGWAYYGSPYQPGVKNDGSRSSYTFGLGFRDQIMYVDLAYVYTMGSEDYYPYDPNIVKPAVNETTSSAFMMTMGFKF
ncbi:MAG: hypothetical protein AB1458_08020 [Bacteroidota bacterium]